MSTPAHYPEGAYEPIKVIEAWGLGFSLGNVLKYIARAGKKDNRLADLEKALYYLSRECDLAKVERVPASYIPVELKPRITGGVLPECGCTGLGPCYKHR